MRELILPASAPRQEWLDNRVGIGSSDIAAILGLSSWSSPYALYHQKRGTLRDTPDNESMRWGRRFEEAIAEEFQEQHEGELWVRDSGLYRSTERPWQIATPDRELYPWQIPPADDPLALLECKTAGAFDGWGDAGTDAIPVHYRAQVQWQMDVLEVGVTYVACLFSGHTYREYIVERDDDDIAFMREAGEAFWRRVLNGDEPDVDWRPATRDALTEIYPGLDDDRAVVGDDIAERYRRAKELFDAAKREKDEAENELREAMGNAKYAVTFDGKVASRSVFERESVDTSLLRTEFPDAWEACKTVSVVDRLNLNRPRKETTTVREALKA